MYNTIFDSTEKFIISGGDDGKIKVWARDNGALLATLQGHKEYINKIVAVKGGDLILSAAEDGIRFFEVENMSSCGGFEIRSIMDIT